MNRMSFKFNYFILLFSVNFVYCVTEDERHRYLFLRQINYDFASKYEEHLDHANKDEHFDSAVKSLQFKKHYNNYLLNLPTPDSLYDPNGHFSGDDRFGFNPLTRQQLNNIYGAKKYIEKESTPSQTFLETEDTSPQKLNINLSKSPSTPNIIDSLPKPSLINDTDLTIDDDNLPPDTAQDIQKSLQNGVEKLNNELKNIKFEIDNLDKMISKYEELADKKNDPKQLIQLHQYITESLDFIKMNSLSLRQFSDKLNSSAEISGLSLSNLDSAISDIEDKESMLEKLENRFSGVSKMPDNPYTLIDNEEMDEIFDTETIPIDGVPATPNDGQNAIVDKQDTTEREPILETEDTTTDSNPLGPPDESSKEDGTPPPDLDIDKLPVEQAEEIRKIPSWGEGASKRWEGVRKIIVGSTMRLFTGGRFGTQKIEKGKSLLREADQIQRQVLKNFFEKKNKVSIE